MEQPVITVCNYVDVIGYFLKYNTDSLYFK